MNKRIEKLAEWAFDEYESVYKSEANIPKEFTEKFAELLIAECLSVVIRSAADSREDGWWLETFEEHFGVKE